MGWFIPNLVTFSARKDTIISFTADTSQHAEDIVSDKASHRNLHWAHQKKKKCRSAKRASFIFMRSQPDRCPHWPLSQLKTCLYDHSKQLLDGSSLATTSPLTRVPTFIDPCLSRHARRDSQVPPPNGGLLWGALNPKWSASASLDCELASCNIHETCLPCFCAQPVHLNEPLGFSLNNCRLRSRPFVNSPSLWWLKAWMLTTRTAVWSYTCHCH